MVRPDFSTQTKLVGNVTELWLRIAELEDRVRELERLMGRLGAAAAEPRSN